MESEISKNRNGGTIDSWCGKCKLIVAHRIEAMVGSKPVRVHCNICQSQHTYKPSEPNKAVAPVQPSKTRPNRYKVLLRGSDGADSKSYSPKDKYQPGDVLNHPSFGVGVATAVKDGTKIEVLFEGGSKLLVHGR